MNTAKAAVKPATANPGTLKPVVKTTTPAPAVPFTKLDGDKAPPLEDRLLRLNQLFKLQGDYDKLQSSLQKLNEFEIKKDGERSRISISDDSRNDFSTYNAEIIQEVTDFLKMKIKEKIKAIEPKLIW